MKIRKATTKDANEISKLMINSIDSVTSKKYSKKQILAMKEYAAEKNVKKYTKKWDVFVALENNKIVGTITLDNNLLVSPYTANSKNFFKDPVGDKLLKFAENYLKKSKIDKINLISLSTTKDYFNKKGYKVVKKLILGTDVKFQEYLLRKGLRK